MFRYFKAGDALEDHGQTMRVLETEAQVYLDAKLDNGEPKFSEVTFSDWVFPVEWKVEGKIIDPTYGELDHQTGEPVVVEVSAEETQA